MSDETPRDTSPPSSSTSRLPRWQNVVGFAAGVTALAWFLIRVIPKPSRAAYPCQRAAFPLASAFVLWLIGLAGGLQAFRFLHRRMRNFSPAAASLGVAALLGLAVWLATLLGGNAGAAADSAPVGWRPGQANAPVGKALGIHPGRVVWIRDPAATLYDGNYHKTPESTWWWETHTDQKRVDAMVSRSLRVLTGAANNAQAWSALFTYHNSKHGKDARGYAAGETVAIKINLNNCYAGYGDQDNNCDASPHMIVALLKQLRDEARIPLDKIIVYDAVRDIPRRFDRVIAQFPGVTWLDKEGKNGRVAPQWVNAITYAVPNGCSPQIPLQIQAATYLINMPLLKGHDLAGVTLASKNHYGSIGYVGANGAKGGRDHGNYLVASKTAGHDGYSPLVDLEGHKDLGGKTILYLMDGLYAIDINIWDVNRKNAGWDRLFGRDAAGNPAWCASLFASQDPVAIDSVGFDFIWAEFAGKAGHAKINITLPNADAYLREEAGLVDPETQTVTRPSGIVYAPNGDGKALPSLGVFEHWNNSMDKKYSRNLDPAKGKGIELVALTP